MFNAHWSESGDARGVVTYSNADTKDVVVVKYNEWARVIDEDGDAFWWNVVTQESAWERPGWNQGSENGVKYYFNNITKWASLEMPYGYPPEYTVEELKALSLPAVSKVATPGPTHDPTSPVIDVKDGAASTPMLTPAPAVGIGGHVLSVPTPAPSTMSKEEKAAQDVMMRKYKKQFLSRACLSRIPLLANLAPHDEVLITSLFRLQVCPAGALLCEAGEAVKNMYVVCQGVVALSAVDPVSAQESCVAHVHPGGAVNVEGLMHESFPSCFKSVGYGSVSCAPTITGSPSITSAAAAVVISAIPPVLDDTASAAGGSATSAGTDVCHLLVLPFSTLAEKIGQYWLLDRRRNLISSNPRFLSLFLESVPFFEGLTHDQMATLCESGDVIQRPGNFVLISEGLPGDAFFVLIHGQVEVSLKGVTTATRGPGQHFGETSLVKGIPCTATVRSLSHCLVLCYHKTAFLSIIRSFPGVRQGLEEFIEQCTVVNLKALKLSLFHRVPEDRMEQLARSAVFRVLLPGEMLYSKGEMSDTGFVVSQGILEVVPEEDVPGGESTVFVASGETIGHSALCFIVPEPRIESAIAVSKCLLLQICRRDICDAFTDEDDLSSFELSVLGDRARLPQIVLHQEANALFVSFLASSPAVPHSLRHVPVGLFPLFDRLRKLNKRISDEQMSQIRAERERPDSKLSRGDSTRLNKLRSSSVFLTSPPPDIMDSVSSLVEFSFSIESELGQWIPEDVKDSVRESLALFKSGAVALSRSALHPIVAAIESKYRTVVSDFRLSPPFQSFLKKQQAAPQPTAKKGLSARLRCWKLTRYNTWQSRGIAFNYDSNEIFVYASADSHSISHTYALLSIAKIERIKRDDKQLRIKFRNKLSKDNVFRFEDAIEKDRFCMLAHFAAHDLEFSDDSHWDEGESSYYEVMMAVKGGSKRRVLWIDRSRGLLIRLSPTANATATDESLAPTLEFSLSSVIKLEPLIGEPCKLRIIATSTTDVYDLKEFAFASPDSRARFSGQINLIRWGVDPAKARVLGVNRAGFSPLPLDLYCSTFNVAESKPPSDVSSLIGLIPPHKFDIYAIALQECNAKDDWQRALAQLLSTATIAPSGMDGPPSGAGYLAPLRPKELKITHSSVVNPRDVTKELTCVPENYVCVGFGSLWAIHLFVFARAKVAEDISGLQISTEATGIGGVMGNKGGVAIGFTFRETTRLAFVSAHLAARATRLAQRAANYADIVKNVALGSGKTPFLHQYHHVFWLGDLNYRTDFGNHGSDKEFAMVVKYAKDKEFEKIVAGDQLRKEMELGTPYAGFRELDIRFPPTYRWERGKEEFSNKKSQNPSYTDRILIRSLPRLEDSVAPLFYASDPSVNFSDHRPVCAGFRLSTVMPYIALDESTSFLSHGNCTIAINQLRYSCELLPPAVMGVINTGLPEKEYGGRSQRATDTKFEPDDALTVQVSAPFVIDPSESEPSPVSVGPDGIPFVLWETDAIPDVLPCMSDTRWLQGQHLLITLKHKNGQVLGQANVSLSDAYNYMAYPVTAESMNLVTVLDHPVLSPMWEAHVKKELSAENTAFFKATRAFQSWASGRPSHELRDEAERIINRFIGSDAPDQVNLPVLIMRNIQAIVTSMTYDAHMFAEAQAEVFRLMDRDSFATRFLPVIRRRFDELRSASFGAPFCVDVVSSGCRVGTLRGYLTMTSLGSLATQEAQVRLAERVFERKRSSRKFVTDSSGTGDDGDSGAGGPSGTKAGVASMERIAERSDDEDDDEPAAPRGAKSALLARARAVLDTPSSTPKELELKGLIKDLTDFLAGLKDTDA